MPVIKENPISYDHLGFDNFLRKKDAPSLYDTPTTTKGIRSGEEIVVGPENIMPRAISRDNLATDALLIPLTLNQQPSQFATGYIQGLNDYIYGAEFDGTNYFLRRFNTKGLLAPFEDGYSVNIPSGVTAAYGCTLTKDEVVVNLKTDRKKLVIYDFSLNKLAECIFPVTGDKVTGPDTKITFDGVNIINYQDAYTPAPELLIKQENVPYWGSNYTSVWQSFIPRGADMGIKKVGMYFKPSYSGTVYYEIRAGEGAGGTLLSQSPTFYVSSQDPETWYEAEIPPVLLTKDTVYTLRIVAVNYFYIYYTNTNPYPDGQSSLGSGVDLGFRIYGTYSYPNNNVSKNRIIRWTYDKTNQTFNFLNTIEWTATSKPSDGLLAFDGKFYYGYNSTEKKIIKFMINPDNTITIASEFPILESVNGILYFNNFIHICYQYGEKSVAVPVSI